MLPSVRFLLLAALWLLKIVSIQNHSLFMIYDISLSQPELQPVDRSHRILFRKLSKMLPNMGIVDKFDLYYCEFAMSRKKIKLSNVEHLYIDLIKFLMNDKVCA